MRHVLEAQARSSTGGVGGVVKNSGVETEGRYVRRRHPGAMLQIELICFVVGDGDEQLFGFQSLEAGVELHPLFHVSVPAVRLIVAATVDKNDGLFQRLWYQFRLSLS